MTRAEPNPPTSTPARAFDGIVVFGGEDWWYHNRGHYDMQMTRQIAQQVVPVVYVNSIGLRTPQPREGRMFWRRVRRKMESVRRGFVEVEPGFGVLSPVTAPSRLVRSATAGVLRSQVRSAMRTMGINRPLIWIACPTAAPFVQSLSPAGLVYQRTDRLECFPGVDRACIAAHDRTLKRDADLTLFCATTLYEEEQAACARAACIDHGVDHVRFAEAGAAVAPTPIDGLPRPRAGFVGGVDEHTFDSELFDDVVRRLPHVSFVVVGAVSIEAPWQRRSNVTLLGQQTLERVPALMAACDVLLMPWRENPWIEGCNPVKLKEYLAVGRPVVSTPFRELTRFGNAVHVAGDADSFVRAIEAATETGSPPAAATPRFADWSEQAARVLATLVDAGLVPERPGKEDVRHAA